MPFVVAQVVSVTPLPSVSARFATGGVCIRQTYPAVTIYPATTTKDNMNYLQLVSYFRVLPALRGELIVPSLTLRFVYE